jgi:hypothetical protein
MKKLFLLLLLPCFNFAQLDYDGELELQLINRGASWNVSIKLTALSARWDANYELTEDYAIVSSSASNPDYYINFEHILHPGNESEFAIGLYKISAFENDIEQAYFFMDWRTSDWNSSLDVYFKYDVANNNFRNWANTETINYTYQTLWDLTGNGLETTGLEDYWENCLGLIHNSNFNPRLVWGPYPDENFSVNYYKIYKKTGTGSFNFCETNSGVNWVDDDETVILGPPQANETICYYKVTAVGWQSEESVETDYTNTVDTRVEGPNQDKISQYDNVKLANSFTLFQNYPNPFNPATIISWYSPKDGFVKLDIFDILGRQIDELVNEYRTSGFSFVEFDAHNLPSGVYFYKIQNGALTEIRKMILQK